MKIFVTGVGSVMGMSIVQALQQDPGIRRMQVMASNSELGTAGEVFVSQKWRGSVFIESPLAASEGYLDFMRSLFLLHQPAIIFPGTQHELLNLRELRDEVFPVAGTGSAFMVIHGSLFENVRAADGGKPSWYNRLTNPTTNQVIGEDLSFCYRAQMAGVPMFVDTGTKTTHLKPIWLQEDDYTVPVFDDVMEAG
jgi:hypothetical protein